MDYRKNSPFWDSENDKILFDELREYRKARLESEFENCDTQWELEELRDGLHKLQKAHHFSFRPFIKRLNKKISEMETPEESDKDSFAPPTHNSPKHDVLNEAEIKTLFATLIE